MENNNQKKDLNYINTKVFLNNASKSKKKDSIKRMLHFLIQKNHHLFENGQYLYNIETSRTILNQLSCSHEDKNDPYLLEIENGIVLPRKHIIENGSFKALGGVMTNELEFIQESKEYDFGGGYQIDTEAIEKRDESVIYLGRGFPHYGVVMIDLIRRLYFKYSKKGKNLKLCYCGVYSEPNTFGKAEQRCWELLNDMGIKKEDVIDVRRPTQFKMVYIPEPGFEYDKCYHKEFLIPYKYISDQVQAKNEKKLYLSRKKMGTIKEVGEEIIEKFFSINGYKVIYPDELSIFQQAAYLKGAEEIASVEGTISHNILFCEKKTKQIVIRKNTRLEPRHFLFNELMDSPVTYIDCLFNFIPGFPRHYDIGPFCMLFNSNIRKFAKDNKYKLPSWWFFSNLVTILKYCQLCINQVRSERKNKIIGENINA